MADAYDLSKLGPHEFENIVNFLALKTLGLGHTGFGPGADAGRDGYFEGEAPYPSERNRWKGVWYLQSKFHAPHLSSNPQRWLKDQVNSEIELFEDSQSGRRWPDNWIIATNIDLSGKSDTGSFDAIRRLVKKASAKRSVKIDVWGGQKIRHLLATHGDVAKYYGHFLTPGHLISALYEEFGDRRASIEEIVRLFVATQFADHTHTKLDQAGSSSDVRPGVHDLFIDLPFIAGPGNAGNGLLAELCSAAAECHRYSLRQQFPDSWREWNRRLKRARVTLIKGGPGQGKSTIGQYLCQIHRAYLILAEDGPRVLETTRDTAKAVRETAKRDGLWPTSPRIPIQVELKEFAHWFSRREELQSRTVLTYLAEMGAKRLGSEVLVKTIKRALSLRSWIVVFDGLDEVPNDFKDAVADEVLLFINDTLIDIDGDVLALCTSRPQGYSGQFARLEGPVVDLAQLDVKTAIRCATPVLTFKRSPQEALQSIATLNMAIRSASIKELMTTPLQAHIMAVVVRDGGRPPERRWALFNQFYGVMKKRESLKDFANPRIAKLLQEDRLLKSVHNRLGFILHARAERSDGAQTTLSRDEFRHLVRAVVNELVGSEIEQTVSDVMEATTERLVLVSTPESGEHVRFDIRQLQEFFAAEFVYSRVVPGELGRRIETIGGDAHWREVMHFLLSALIEMERTSELAVAVQVLRRLDESSEEDGSGLLPRRMARAALLASRLLTEGVVEEHLEDRQSIRPLLDPLFGILDVAALSPLGRLSPEKSRQWLVKLLVDRLFTSAERENVGALFVLGRLLKGEPANGTAATAFKNLPFGFQETLFLLWKPAGDDELGRGVVGESADGVALWVVQAAAEILNSDSWSKFTVRTIRTLLQICRAATVILGPAFAASGISRAATNAVMQCLRLFDAERQLPRSSGRSVVDCGLIDAIPHAENWANGKVPKSLADLKAVALIKETGGLFRLMLACVWWAQNKEVCALHELVRSVDMAGPQRLSVLPSSLQALIPLVGQYSCKSYDVEHLRNISVEAAKELSTRIGEKRMCPTYAGLALSPTKEATSERWQAVTASFPRIAIDLALNSNRFRWRDFPGFVPELIALMESEVLTAAEYILKWGKLEKSLPGLLKKLKLKLREEGPPRKLTFHFRAYDEIEPFSLRLPQDTPLLAFLAPALVDRFVNREPEWPRAVVTLSRTGSLRNVLAQYGLDAGNLRLIAESVDFGASVRSGALALFWLSMVEREPNQSGTQLDLARERFLYQQLVDEYTEPMLARALVKGVLVNCPETDPIARSFVTYLLERCLDGAGPRAELANLLGTWRERSAAPVNGRQALQTWLGYSSEAATSGM